MSVLYLRARGNEEKMGSSRLTARAGDSGGGACAELNSASLTLTLAKTRQTKPSFSWTLHRTATRQPPPGPLTTRKEEATRGGVGGSVVAPHWNPKTVGLPPLSHPRTHPPPTSVVSCSKAYMLAPHLLVCWHCLAMIAIKQRSSWCLSWHQ